MELNSFRIFPNENFIDLDLYQCGREHCIPGHSFGPAIRNHFLFHYVYSGKGSLTICDETGTDHSFEVGPGQGFLIFPSQIATYVADTQNPWHYSWLEFDGLRVKESLVKTSLSRSNGIFETKSSAIRNQLVTSMNFIVDRQEATVLSCIGHLYLFFDALIQGTRIETHGYKGRMADYYVKEAVHYLEQNYSREISIEEVSAVLGIDRSYFGKIFKKAMNRSPQQFLILYRMIKAAELLKTTSLPIKEISNMVGYDNQLHFSKLFKQTYGLSPRIWRNSPDVRTPTALEISYPYCHEEGLCAEEIAQEASQRL